MVRYKNYNTHPVWWAVWHNVTFCLRGRRNFVLYNMFNIAPYYSTLRPATLLLALAAVFPSPTMTSPFALRHSVCKLWLEQALSKFLARTWNSSSYFGFSRHSWRRFGGVCGVSLIRVFVFNFLSSRQHHKVTVFCVCKKWGVLLDLLIGSCLILSGHFHSCVCVTCLCVCVPTEELWVSYCSSA